MKFKDSAQLSRIDSDGRQYYRISFSHGNEWYLRDFSNGNLIPYETSHSKRLEQQYQESLKGTSFPIEKTTDEVLLLVAEAIKNKTDYDSKSHQFNSGKRFIVVNENGAIFLYLTEDKWSQSPETRFRLATFNEHEATFYFSNKVVMPRKSRMRMYNTLFKKLNQAFECYKFSYIHQETKGRDTRLMGVVPYLVDEMGNFVYPYNRKDIKWHREPFTLTIPL